MSPGYAVVVITCDAHPDRRGGSVPIARFERQSRRDGEPWWRLDDGVHMQTDHTADDDQLSATIAEGGVETRWREARENKVRSRSFQGPRRDGVTLECSICRRAWPNLTEAKLGPKLDAFAAAGVRDVSLTMLGGAFQRRV